MPRFWGALPDVDHRKVAIDMSREEAERILDEEVSQELKDALTEILEYRMEFPGFINTTVQGSEFLGSEASAEWREACKKYASRCYGVHVSRVAEEKGWKFRKTKDGTEYSR